MCQSKTLFEKAKLQEKQNVLCKTYTSQTLFMDPKKIFDPIFETSSTGMKTSESKAFLFTKLLFSPLSFFNHQIALARRQQDSKRPFGFLVKLPPAHLPTTHGGGFTPSFECSTSSREAVNINFSLWFDPNGNKPESIVLVAEALPVAVAVFISRHSTTDR